MVSEDFICDYQSKGAESRSLPHFVRFYLLKMFKAIHIFHSIAKSYSVLKVEIKNFQTFGYNIK